MFFYIVQVDTYSILTELGADLVKGLGHAC